MLKRSLILVVVVALVAAIVPLIGSEPSWGNASSVVAAGRVHKSFQPVDGKIFVLVIGSDARHGNPDGRTRADALHIVGLNTKTMRGGILNFPRDSWVNIPGRGFGKINESLYTGGPRLVARTMESITGIRLDYWMLTGFEGFRGIVHGLGGVRFSFKQAFFDTGSGATIEAGTKRLNQRSALAFVRARKSLPNGDIGRSTNQGRFLMALLRGLRRDVRRHPAAVLEWMAIGKKFTRFNISPEELFRLSVLATQVKPKRVDNVTVPVSIGSAGSASVVFISPGARSIYKRFRKNASL